MTRSEPRWHPPSRAELNALAPPAPRAEPPLHGAFLGLIVKVAYNREDPDVVSQPIRQAIEQAGGRVIYLKSSLSPLKIIPKPWEEDR